MLLIFFISLWRLCVKVISLRGYGSCVTGGYLCVVDYEIQREFDLSWSLIECLDILFQRILFVLRLLCACCDVRQNVLTFCLCLGCCVLAMMSDIMSWHFVSEEGLECASLFLSMFSLWGWVSTTYFCCVCLWYVLVLYQVFGCLVLPKGEIVSSVFCDSQHFVKTSEIARYWTRCLDMLVRYRDLLLFHFLGRFVFQHVFSEDSLMILFMHYAVQSVYFRSWKIGSSCGIFLKNDCQNI